MNRLRICAWIETSSEATDSSQTRKRGCKASARAIEMRWRWPPENWCGKRWRRAGSSPARRICAHSYASISAREAMPWTSGASPIASATRMRGLRLACGSWKISCTSRWTERSPCGERPKTSTSPVLGGSRPAAMRPSVDLPEPDSPTSPTNSPVGMVRSMPSSARMIGWCLARCSLTASPAGRPKCRVSLRVSNAGAEGVAVTVMPTPRRPRRGRTGGGSSAGGARSP